MTCPRRPLLQPAKGAHLLLQVRAKVLNDELAQVFQRWYPVFDPPVESLVTEDLAA